MGKKAVSIVLCIALIAAAICAVVFKNQANSANDTLTSVQADLASTKTSLETAQADLTTAQEALTTAEETLATTEADLTAAQEALATTEADLTAANETIATLEAAAAEAPTTEDLATAQAEAARLQNVYDLQKSYVANLEQRATQLLEANAKIDVLTAQLANAETAEPAETDDTADLEAQVARLQNAYDLQKAYVEKLEVRATQLLEAQAQIDVLNAQLANAETAETADTSDLEDELSAAQAQIEELTAQLTAAETAAAEAPTTEDLEAAQAEAARLENAYDLQKAYVEKLEVRATQLLEAQAQIDVLNAKLANAEAAETESDDTADLEAQVARLQNAYDLQKAYVEKLEQRATQLLEAQAQIDVLNAQLANAEAAETETDDTAELEAQVARLQNAYDLQKAYVEKLEQRATQLLEAQAQIDVLKAQLAALTAEGEE